MMLNVAIFVYLIQKQGFIFYEFQRFEQGFAAVSGACFGLALACVRRMVPVLGAVRRFASFRQVCLLRRSLYLRQILYQFIVSGLCRLFAF